MIRAEAAPAIKPPEPSRLRLVKSKRNKADAAANAFLRQHGEGALANDQSDRTERRRRRLHSEPQLAAAHDAVVTLQEHAATEFEFRFRAPWSSVERVRIDLPPQPSDGPIRADSWRARLVVRLDRWGLRFRINGKMVPMPMRTPGQIARWRRGDNFQVVSGSFFFDEHDMATIAILLELASPKADESNGEAFARIAESMKKAIQRHGRKGTLRGPAPATRYPKPGT